MDKKEYNLRLAEIYSNLFLTLGLLIFVYYSFLSNPPSSISQETAATVVVVIGLITAIVISYYVGKAQK
jgi:hypothetical protein